uniref:Uncharacterized protein n=1 Tax=Chromera velia CCMP2878 TaxID=1169474 RepID=A0A0G4GFL1_9ALVE|eukprot:Cvel_21675.t1-p1 / transcript=Cvel_21675.t1 / gene=Cvel_21675 / organism=Chromera_velia_CCMP2878 / gene_product=hypothetical protein / transcript_product=hypothetical protein / location=Cvel_scaffold2053:32559-35407(-) / protein_length=183 / sequence_SO=supercontig / SO=protein_coding / is_pseudo=false
MAFVGLPFVFREWDPVLKSLRAVSWSGMYVLASWVVLAGAVGVMKKKGKRKKRVEGEGATKAAGEGGQEGGTPKKDEGRVKADWCQYLWGGSDSCCCYFFFSVPAATPALHLSAVKNQSLSFRADAEAAEEDDAVRCESPRGGAGGQAEGGYEWREEGEEEEDEEEDEEEEAWREEDDEEEEE